MKAQNDTIKEMLNGFEPLENFTRSLKLTFAQKMKVQMLLAAVAIYRVFILPFKKKQTRMLKEGLEKCTDMKIQVPRYDLPKDDPGNHYLSEDEIRDFERTGFIKPFRVLSEEDAHARRKFIKDAYARGFDGYMYIDGELRDTLEKHDEMHIGYAGLHQALRYPEMREVLQAPEIAHRMASVLGPEVLIWRSQFFEKEAGSQGTFWHQSGAFREVAKQEKLVPTQSVSHGILQLTAWVALTDVTIKNGALRIMPGTFEDGRIEFLQAYVQDNMIDYLARLPRKSLPQLIKAALFSSGAFIRSQALFLTIPLLVPDIFEDREVVDIEVKAGEAVIFTSMNMHGSYNNVTGDQNRFSMVGRYTANHVKVFPGTEHSYLGTPEGVKAFSLEHWACIQAHGEDSYCYNKILKEKTGEAPVQDKVIA